MTTNPLYRADPVLRSADVSHTVRDSVPRSPLVASYAEPLPLTMPFSSTLSAPPARRFARQVAKDRACRTTVDDATHLEDRFMYAGGWRLKVSTRTTSSALR